MNATRGMFEPASAYTSTITTTTTTANLSTTLRPWYRYIEVFPSNGRQERKVYGTYHQYKQSDNKHSGGNLIHNNHNIYSTTASDSSSSSLLGDSIFSRGNSNQYQEEESKLPSFTATKSHHDNAIYLEIHSTSLHHQLLPVCLPPIGIGAKLTFRDVVDSYLMLKQLVSPSSSNPSLTPNPELHLLVEDFLCSPRIYDGIDVDAIIRPPLPILTGIMSTATAGASPGAQALAKEIHSRRLTMNLNNLDFLFVIGQARSSTDPPNTTTKFLPIFQRVFHSLLQRGDLKGLKRVCEPLVATRKIEWRHSDELLLEGLGSGRLGIFRYILDLASRTQPQDALLTEVGPEEQQRAGFTDCTFDPLYMAIRLGHVGTVEKLLKRGERFDGFCSVEGTTAGEALGGGQRSTLLLTPLTAAAYWGKAAVVRLVLRHGLADQSSAQTALDIARSRGHEEVVTELQTSSWLSQRSQGFNAYDAAFPTGFSTMGPSTAAATMATTGSEPFESVGMPWGGELPLAPLVDGSGVGGLLDDGPSFFEDGGIPTTRVEGTDSEEPSLTPNISDEQSQEFGGRISSALREMCVQIQAEAGKIGRPDLEPNFREFCEVWERGMKTIRKVMRNRPPDSLTEVLDCLLVSAAITKAKDGVKTRAYQSFVADLPCWRTAVPDADKTIFDTISMFVWGFPDESPPIDWDNAKRQTLNEFHTLVDKVVAKDNPVTTNIPPVSSATGATNATASEPQVLLRDTSLLENYHQLSALSTPSSNVLGVGDWTTAPSNPTTMPEGEAGSWVEFAPSLTADYLAPQSVADIPMLRYYGQTQSQAQFPLQNTNKVNPLVSLLLGSVAMGVVFSVLLVLHQGNETPETLSLARHGWNLGLACSILRRLIQQEQHHHNHHHQPHQTHQQHQQDHHHRPHNAHRAHSTSSVSISGGDSIAAAAAINFGPPSAPVAGSTSPFPLLETPATTARGRSPTQGSNISSNLGAHGGYHNTRTPSVSISSSGGGTAGGLTPNNLSPLPHTTYLSPASPSGFGGPSSPYSLSPSIGGRSPALSSGGISPVIPSAELLGVPSFTVGPTSPHSPHSLHISPPSSPSTSNHSLDADHEKDPLSMSITDLTASMSASVSTSIPRSPSNGGGGGPHKSGPCPSCHKTFSSVTNFRKHMRDRVCQPERKRRWLCRNKGCERLLSTRWYRNQHEDQYCQFKAEEEGGTGEA